MKALPNILATKLYAPPLTTQMLARQRLLARLDAGLRRALTLVSAPAGFGKTTLLSAWAANTLATLSASVAWLTLDPQDDMPAPFWCAVISAWQTLNPALKRELLPLLHSSSTNSDNSLITSLVNQLNKHTLAPLVLVLDNYQVIDSAEIHAALTFFITHLPAHVHVVLSSRSTPPLPLARLRALGQLNELHDSDLRFTLNETTAFLNDVMGLDLAPETVAALDARLEGWVTGLYLAAISMQERGERSAPARLLNSGHAYIKEYLLQEVLEPQAAPLRNFLLQTSILESISVSLADAVTASKSSAEILDTLVRANLFLTPLDQERRWCRYHHLFGEMLRARLEAEQPAFIPELHRRASAWYAQHAEGDTTLLGEAIRHALAAGDETAAVELINQVVGTLWRKNDHATLRMWLTSLPPSVLQTQPRQAIRLALMQLANGSIANVAPLLEIATAALAHAKLSKADKAELCGRIAVVRCHLACLHEEYDEALRLANEARDLLPESAGVARSLAALGIALAYHMQGTLNDADASYRETIQFCQAIGERYVEMTARCMRGRLLQERGELQAATEAYQAALQQAIQDSKPLPIAGWALIGLGTVAYARNELTTAQTFLRDGIELVRRGGVRMAISQGLEGLVRLRLAQGDLAGAREAVSQLVQNEQANQIPQFIRSAQALQTLVNLTSGDLHAATKWAHMVPRQAAALWFPDKTTFAVYLQVLIAQGQTETARHCLGHERTALEPRGHVETQIELYLLEAKTLVSNTPRRHPPDAALVVLEAALTLAAPAGFVRLFLDAGKQIEPLLAQWALRHAPDNPLRAFVERLLDAFKKAQEQKPLVPESATAPSLTQVPSTLIPRLLIEPLSEREIQVLQLMAAGLSNQAIADRLIISEPTVKKHASNIFGKLDVTNRTEAVARARALSLLP